MCMYFILWGSALCVQDSIHILLHTRIYICTHIHTHICQPAHKSHMAYLAQPCAAGTLLPTSYPRGDPHTPAAPDTSGSPSSKQVVDKILRLLHHEAGACSATRLERFPTAPSCNVWSPQELEQIIVPF